MQFALFKPLFPNHSETLQKAEVKELTHTDTGCIYFGFDFLLHLTPKLLPYLWNQLSTNFVIVIVVKSVKFYQILIWFD